MAGILAPVPIQQWLDANGDPVANGSLAFYAAGTSTPAVVYADAALTTPLPQPVPLDAAGRPATASGPTEVWLDPTQSYKEVLQTSTGQVIWTADQLTGPLATAAEVIGIYAGGQVNNIPLDGRVRQHILYFASNTDTTVSGFSFTTPPSPGDRIVMYAAGMGNVWLQHAGPSTDWMLNLVASGPTPLAGNTPGGWFGRAEYTYLGGHEWFLIVHEQGPWITMPFNPANFATYPAAGTGWTVAAGNVTRCAFQLRGRMVFLSFQIAGSTVAGAPNDLVIFSGAWGWFTPVAHEVTIGWYNDSTGNGPSHIFSTAGNQVAIGKIPAATWTAGVVSDVQGVAQFEVS